MGSTKDRAKEMLEKILVTGALATTLTTASAAGEKNFTEEEHIDRTEVQKQTSSDINTGGETIAPFASENVRAFNDRIDATLNPGATTHTTESGVTYTVKGSSIQFNGSVGISTTLGSSQDLEPRRYRTADDGLYHIGPLTNRNISVLHGRVDSALGRLVVEHEVCKDIQLRQKNGEDISAVETNLLTKHQQSMEKWGLKEKDGKLVQINPRGMQMTETTVKNASDLEKQIKKDIKEAGIVNKNGDLVMMMMSRGYDLRA